VVPLGFTEIFTISSCPISTRISSLVVFVLGTKSEFDGQLIEGFQLLSCRIAVARYQMVPDITPHSQEPGATIVELFYGGWVQVYVAVRAPK
jgi:hypothetical protein